MCILTLALRRRLRRVPYTAREYEDHDLGESLRHVLAFYGGVEMEHSTFDYSCKSF